MHGVLLVGFTYIIQGYLTGIVAIVRLPNASERYVYFFKILFYLILYQNIFA